MYSMFFHFLFDLKIAKALYKCAREHVYYPWLSDFYDGIKNLDRKIDQVQNNGVVRIFLLDLV